jgi:hypothetical protein
VRKTIGENLSAIEASRSRERERRLPAAEIEKGKEKLRAGEENACYLRIVEE